MAPFTPPPITTETLKFRVDSGNMARGGGQRGSLTRVAQKLGALQASQQQQQDDQQQTSSSSVDPAAVATAQKEFSREVSFLELELIKLVMYDQKLERQIAANNAAQEDCLADIDATKQRAETTWQEAQVARRTKSCLEEYDALAKLVNTQNPLTQSELQTKIEKTQNEIQSVQGDIDTLSSKIHVREAQYTLLMQYMLDLKTEITNESISNDDDKDKEKENVGKKKKTIQQQNQTDNGDDVVVPMDVDDA